MYNILVCDDDREIVEAIDIYLSKEGYNVIKAYDGVEAIEKLEKEEIHLLLIDIMMPKLDGIRATLKIRQNSSIPIIIWLKIRVMFTGSENLKSTMPAKRLRWMESW